MEVWYYGDFYWKQEAPQKEENCKAAGKCGPGAVIKLLYNINFYGGLAKVRSVLLGKLAWWRFQRLNWAILS